MDFELIKCKDAPSYLERRDTFFVDLRDPEQYMEYHLPGARNFPYEYMEEWEHRLPKTGKIIFYCEHGNLSLMAAKRLSRRGYRVGALIGGVECFLSQNAHMYKI
ncbi:Thiosulfate sulfurtransferase GlpE [Eubacterium plexicaudatum ASF492]|uniref:Rhodanese domain-containing protein n=1 Tax=Eubacterium plexicaudatum ASF492 TaxID=1235802 RepID=N2AIS9_9FIRM|nr:Thiosulfate sulfurtransferase GlpE [Eubacterium plexicaudatum ASF492]